MTLEPTGLTESQVMNVRDRSLEAAYETHDVAYDILDARLRAHDLTTVEHGDEARDADEVLYGDGPDIAVYTCAADAVDDHDPVAYVEVKSKEQSEWFGRCNRRHYNEYVNFANEVDVPVFVWFALVDAGESSASGFVHREAFFEVESRSQFDGAVTDVTDGEVVFYSEDVVELDEDSLLAVDGDDVVGVRSGDSVVAGYPNIHGNDVVELADSEFRSFPWFLHRVAD